jgi:hypothetical protein
MACANAFVNTASKDDATISAACWWKFRRGAISTGFVKATRSFSFDD